jgi:hypothetical protein
LTQIKKFAWYGSSVALAAFLAVAILVTNTASVAHAAPAVTQVSPADVNQPVPANNTATATVRYTSDAGAANDGNLIQFTTSRGTFANGQSTFVTTLARTGGADCSDATSCIANAVLKSDTAGTATVVAQNLSAADSRTTTVRFYGAPNATGTGALSLATDGALSATTSTLLTNASQVVTLVNGFRDATTAGNGGPILLRNLSVTANTTVGTFQQSGLQTFAGLTVADGQLPTLTLVLPNLTTAQSGTVSVTMSTPMGDLTVSGMVHVSGNTAGSIEGPAAGSPNARIVADNTGGTVTFGVRVRDVSNNLINGPTVTATRSATALGTLSAVTNTNAGGVYTVDYTPVANQFGDQSITFSIAANASTGQAAVSFTVEFVQSGAPTAVVITGDDQVITSGNATYTATVVDAGGRTVHPNRGGSQHAVTFAVTGTNNGNLILPSALTNLSGVGTDAAGTATATFISGGVNGSYTVTAVLSVGGTATTTSGFKTITVTSTPTTPPVVGGDGEFAAAPTFTGGLPNFTTFGGGTLAEFQLAANAQPAMARIFVQNMTTGAMTVYVSGGGVVNAPFNSAYAGGISAGSNVIIFLP